MCECAKNSRAEQCKDRLSSFVSHLYFFVVVVLDGVSGDSAYFILFISFIRDRNKAVGSSLCLVVTSGEHHLTPALSCCCFTSNYQPEAPDWRTLVSW